MLLILGVLVVVNLYVFVWDKKTGVRAIQEQAARAQPAMNLPEHPLVPAPTAIAGLSGSGASAPTPAHPAIEGTVVKGDRLGKLLKRSGLTATDADEVIRALAGVLDYKTIKPGETYLIERGPDGRVSRFELTLSKTHHVRADRKSSGELVGIADPPR